MNARTVNFLNVVLAAAIIFVALLASDIRTNQAEGSVFVLRSLGLVAPLVPDCGPPGEDFDPTMNGRIEIASE